MQSLKLHFCNIQAKQDLKEKAVAFQKPDELNSSKSARADSKTRDVFENEASISLCCLVDYFMKWGGGGGGGLL